MNQLHNIDLPHQYHCKNVWNKPKKLLWENSTRQLNDSKIYQSLIWYL